MVDYTKKASSITPMSTGELGSSLLAAKGAREEKDRKAAKKNDKIQAVLGLSLAATGLARKAYQKREAELNAARTLSSKNNESQVRQINAISELVSAIPENFMPNENNIDKRLEAYMATPDYEVFKLKTQPIMDKRIQSMYGSTRYQDLLGTSAYSKMYNMGTQELAKTFLSIDPETNLSKSQTFVNELRKAYNDNDLDRVSLLKKGIGLETHDLTALEAKAYDSIQKQYQNRNNPIDAIVEIGKRWGTKEGRNGGINLHNKISKETLGTAPLDSVLESINLNASIRTILDETIALGRTSPEAAAAEYDSTAMKSFKEDAVPQYISNMLNLVEEGEYKSEVTGGLTFVGSNDLKEYLEIATKDDTTEKRFVRDVGILSIRLKDTQFQKKIYQAYYKKEDNYSLSEFMETMSDPETRTQFAAGIALERGLETKEIPFGFDKKEYKAKPNYDYTGGIVPLMTGELQIIPPVTDKSISDPDNTFKLPKGYAKLSKRIKRISFDSEYDAIISSSFSDTNKKQLIIKLFKEVKHPDFGDDIEKYRINLNKRKEKELARRRTERPVIPTPISI